jgi:hypothetical protein
VSNDQGSTPARVAGASGWADRHRRSLLAAGAAAVVFVAVGAFVWSWTSSPDDAASSEVGELAPTESAATAVPPVEPTIVSVAELRQATGAGAQPVYWAGQRQGTRLEYTRRTDGTTYVRYLTGAASAGAPGAGYVVVATYPQPDAYTRVTRAAREENLFTADLPKDGVAVIKPDRPGNIYLVYPDRQYQIEVYAPSAEAARELVFGGAIRPVG